MSTLTITLPHPAKELRPNRDKPQTIRGLRATMAAYMREKKAARTRAKLLTLEQLKARAFTPEAYCLTWYYSGVRPDSDNCLASCKPYLDGICAALRTDDSLLECNGIRRVHTLEPDKRGTLELAFVGAFDGERELTDDDLLDIEEMCRALASNALTSLAAAAPVLQPPYVAHLLLQEFYMAEHLADYRPHIALRYEELRAYMEHARLLDILDSVKGDDE